jgi:hypothetical protein
VKVYSDEAILRFSTINLGKIIKKSNLLFIEEERKMLVQSMCQLTSPSSLNLRFAYFTCEFFLLKGCFELHVKDFDEFSLLFSPTNIILRFC